MRSLTRADVRKVDRAAIQDCSLPGVELVENAGAVSVIVIDTPRLA